MCFHSEYITWKAIHYMASHIQSSPVAYMQAEGIHGSWIHSISVCVSSQVYSKLQMVYTEALRSLTHIPPPSMPTSHCL